MIALGWCLANQLVPAPLLVSTRGPIAVLCVDPEDAPTARDRLGLLQRAFDAGIELVPLSTIREWPADAAIEVASQAARDLQCQIIRLSGQGQITLRLCWSEGAKERPAVRSPCGGGRDWLRQRAESVASDEAVTETSIRLLSELAKEVGATSSSVQATRQGAVVHFLMPRDSLRDLGRRLSLTKLSPARLTNAVFSLSGPWPAFDFVQIPQMVRA